MRKRIFLLATAAAVATAMVDTAAAQTSSSPYTSATRYDEMGRVTGTISPNDTGRNYLKFLATRTTYDDAGRPIKVEDGYLDAWQSQSVKPKDWPGFHIVKTIQFTYDAQNQKLTERIIGEDLVTASLIQYSYDLAGRLECTAVRMNPASYTNLPGSACLHYSPAGADGPDRITQNKYNAGGLLVQVRVGVKTSDNGLSIDNSKTGAAEVTYSYTRNGKLEYIVDAGGHKALACYDTFDRQSRSMFPSSANPLPGQFDDSTPDQAISTSVAANGTCTGTLSSYDYEEYGYDSNGNRTSLRKRDGYVLGYEYDLLNRVKRKIVPERPDLDPMHTRDVYYAYNARGLQTEARFDSLSGEGVSNQFDGFGRLDSSTSTMGGVSRAVSYRYDANSNRTKIILPAATYPPYGAMTFEYNYAFDGLNRLASVTNLGGAELKRWRYDDKGRLLTGIVIDNQTSAALTTTTYGYDAASRVSGITHDLYSTPADLVLSYTYNHANQIATRGANNDSYSWTGSATVNRAYGSDGLNRYSSAGSATFTYDRNGNLTSDGEYYYTYDIENRMVYTSGGYLMYDPLGRLFETWSDTTGTLQYLYDGDDLIGEYDAPVNRKRVYVHATNDDTPFIWFEWTSAGRELYADHQGSIVAIAHPLNGYLAINAYDEYGIPLSTNVGRFQYTGQVWLPEAGMYYYKARMYSPTLGRFMQTDPIGYEDQFNLYAYVGNDPVNRVDPSGLSCVNTGGNYSCKIDQVAYVDGDGKVQVRDATDDDHVKYAGLESALTNAVNAAARAGEEQFSVDTDLGSFFVTGNDVASNLANATARVDPDNLTLDPRSASADPYMDMRVGLLGIYSNALSIGSDGDAGAPDQLANLFMHEGLHQTRGERDLLGNLSLSQEGHQGSYNETARRISEAGRVR